MEEMKTKYRVVGYKAGELTNPKDIIYDTKTKKLSGLWSCIGWAIRKGARAILIILEPDLPKNLDETEEQLSRKYPLLMHR